MTKNNILYISRAYGEHAGGMERLSFEFVQAAKKNSDIQLKTIVHQTPKGVSLFSARVRSIWFVLTVIPRALQAARDVDVVHIGDPVLSFIGWLIKKVYRKPVLVTVHGLDVSFSNGIYQSYLRAFFHSFDGYLPISAYARELVVDKGIPSSNVHVLTPGVVDRLYDQSASTHELARILAMSPEQVQNTHIIFTAGRLVPRKGHAWFIREVLPSLPQNTVYVIAGDGPAMSDITASIEDAQQGGRVKLLGRVSEKDLITLYNTVSVFVQPNIPYEGDAEGFGLVLLEAALCNRVVIASRLEGITDAIVDGKNGLLVQAQNGSAWVQTCNRILSESPADLHPREYTLTNYSWETKIQQYRSHVYEVVATSEAGR